MHTGHWSPFDPKWYQAAFDKYVSTADELFNTDFITQQGFVIPDADGSRSSIFRNSAVTNNSFDEEKLRDTLTDIYLNNTNRLKAANHDNVHFYQWHGHMDDMNIQQNTQYCTFVIPVDTFIAQQYREIFKLSQFYRKWIKVEDILNNWDVFKWHCMLFINRKVYSEYELRIDDQEVTIRFKYTNYWLKHNVSVDIYKFDTCAQCRVLISRELCEKQWGWRMPVSYITDKRVLNHDHVMVAFNKISDMTIREKESKSIEVLGDNLEFLNISDGIIDLNNISEINRLYIKSETSEWLWMSIIVPKFMHEYPIMLPTDVVYRPYVANFRKVYTNEGDFIQSVKIQNSDTHQVYVDLSGGPDDERDGWIQMIRPIVFQDAYDGKFDDPFISFLDELRNLRDLTVLGADIIEQFHFAILDTSTDDEFNKGVDSLTDIMQRIHDAHNSFLDKLLIEYNQVYEGVYKKFLNLINIIRAEGKSCSRFTVDSKSDSNFWNDISPLIHIPQALVEKYNIIDTANAVKNHRSTWESAEDYTGKIRFQRPVDTTDFWTFEYDISDKVWRPVNLDVQHHYPDVYTLSDPNETTPSLNRIFKAFFFYSDTMNVREIANDIERPSAAWDDDISKYTINPFGNYHDIFMEKFYWMGIRAIYNGLLLTHTRWELLEYVIDNDSYQRFNGLFMKSSDPYFKMSVASFLKSSNFGFAFDENVSKMNEALSKELLSYKMLTNFEIYLEKTWAPSYFDMVMKITDIDSLESTTTVIRRPRNTFDSTRIIPILISIQTDVYGVVKNVNDELEWILHHLSMEDYRLIIDNFTEMRDVNNTLVTLIDSVLKRTTELDLAIYSIDDVNDIVNGITGYLHHTDKFVTVIDTVYQDTMLKKHIDEKRKCMDTALGLLNGIPSYIQAVLDVIANFDMHHFMVATNDLRSYFNSRKENPDDNSLLGWINKFNDPWCEDVKNCRDDVFRSSAVLYGKFNPVKSYTNDEMEEFVHLNEKCREDTARLMHAINEFYRVRQIDPDQIIIDRLEYTLENLDKMHDELQRYIDARNALIGQLTLIKAQFAAIRHINNSETEGEYMINADNIMNQLVSAISYVAGDGDGEGAFNAYDNLVSVTNTWNDFIVMETTVFNRITNLVEPPITFMTVLNDKRALLEAIIAYMKSVNDDIGSDSNSPSYMAVYETTDVELKTGGFNHIRGNIAFFPALASYKIEEVNNTIGIVTKISPMNFRNTTFRNPMWQSHSYDSTTNGEGLGITAVPTNVTTTPIVNDDIIDTLIKRAENIVAISNQYINTPNPYANTSLNAMIPRIDEWMNDWNIMRDKYADNISSKIKEYTDNISMTMNAVKLEIGSYSEFRSRIDASAIILAAEKFMSENDIIEDKCKYAYANLLNYYGTGSSWDNIDELGALITEFYEAIHEYSMKNQLSTTEFAEVMDSVFEAIDGYDSHFNDINNDVVCLDEMIKDSVDKQHDVWYRIDNVLVGSSGTGYKIGDIVKVIPHRQTNSVGDEIDDQWDEIKNDVILMQITEVENGSVIGITPFMNYAIPYQLKGIRSTMPMVGTGSGLIIDINSHQVTLADTQLDHVETKKKFSDTDMIAFKFENIHDLNISYEVFIGGRQITDFVQRHESVTVANHPKNIDVIYVKASQLEGLANVNIQFAAEDYIMYRVDNVTIIDPGAGYYVGQEIFVGTEMLPLRLKVAELVFGPLKGIKDVTIAGGNMGKDVNLTASGLSVVPDDTQTIDDEFNSGSYDKITDAGYDKAATRSYPMEDYPFHVSRFDDLPDGDRHRDFIYGDINKSPNGPDGDPDHGWYAGHRIDNSQVPMEDKRIWNGIVPLIPTIDPFLQDYKRMPPDTPIKAEYQRIVDICLHRSVETFVSDLTVDRVEDLPKNTDEWPEGKVGSTVTVNVDTNYGNHRMLYTIRTFIADGSFIYDVPKYSDYMWNTIDVDWMNCDWYPDMPTQKAIYPTAPYTTAKTYRDIQCEIIDGKHEAVNAPSVINHTTYIKDLTIDDLSLFNWTTKEWEDLHDENKWKLEVVDDDAFQHWGFRLTCLMEGTYSYDVSLFLNKTGEVMSRLTDLVRSATVDISATISHEVHKAAKSISVNTGNTIRIRKLFPYEQKETYTIGRSADGRDLGYEMNFKLANYLHFRNEIHMEDIKVYNKTAGRFEDVMDPSMFELRIKDKKAYARGREIQTNITNTIIADAGNDFITGDAWAYSKDYDVQIFGRVTAAFPGDGHMITFVPLYVHNAPDRDLQMELTVYQNDSKANGIIVVTFETKEVPVYGDGYIHNVQDPYAPIKGEFKLIVQYDLDGPTEYDVIINKNPTSWKYSSDRNQENPAFYVSDVPVPADRLYVIGNNGRLPLVNPSTKIPTVQVVNTDDGMLLKLNQVYRRYDQLEVRSVPYPMRSVYVQRRIPSHGYINLAGKINKPLNKKYFEFWVNGKLLFDEVTIISPTKIFLHGLRSLKNLEIIEINRDPNEYFSDIFLSVSSKSDGRPYPLWDYYTYLDAALEGKLPENYSIEEQEYLLTPVWRQVDEDHPEYKNFPPNVDIDPDILVSINSGESAGAVKNPPYQSFVLDIPTIEGVQVTGRNLSFSDFGLLPITDDELTDIMNEEWKDEIKDNPYFPPHTVISDDVWYGTTARLYDRFGIRVHNLNDAAYTAADLDLLVINTSTRSAKIVKNNIEYDLT